MHLQAAWNHQDCFHHIRTALRRLEPLASSGSFDRVVRQQNDTTYSVEQQNMTPPLLLDTIIQIASLCDQDLSPLQGSEMCFASAWQIPEFLDELYSQKPEEQAEREHKYAISAGARPPWSPLRTFSEMARAVIITGSCGNFEIGTCGELLERFWPDVGIKALRLVATAIFLLNAFKAKVEEQRSCSETRVL